MAKASMEWVVETLLDEEMRVERPVPPLTINPTTGTSEARSVSGRYRVEKANLLAVEALTKAVGFENLDKAGAQVQLEMLESCWLEIMRQHEINETGFRNTQLEEERAIYVSAKTALRRKMQGDPIATPQTTRIQLWEGPMPDKLPIFSGEFDKWAPFRDIFMAEVHNNPEMSRARKLIKLSNALEGRAKQALGEYSVAEEANYERAWHDLCNIYDNKHLTVRSHLQKIKGLRHMKEDVGDELQLVRDTVRVNRRHLLSLFPAHQLFDFVYIHEYIEPLLSPSLRNQWENSRTSNALPTWEEMMAFLDRQTTNLLSKAAQPFHPDPPSKVTPPGHLKQEEQINRPNHKESRGTSRCYYCRESHRLLFCKRFGESSLNTKIEFLQSQSRCPACFSQNHGEEQCPRSECPVCPGRKHYRLLCPKNKMTAPRLTPQ